MTTQREREMSASACTRSIPGYYSNYTIDTVVLHTRTRVALDTFRASRRRREMYIGHARLSVCLSVRTVRARVTARTVASQSQTHTDTHTSQRPRHMHTSGVSVKTLLLLMSF